MAITSNLGRAQLGREVLGEVGAGAPPPGIYVSQNVTLPSENAFPAGGVISFGLQVAQLSTLPSGNSFPAGGVIFLGSLPTTYPSTGAGLWWQNAGDGGLA